MMTESKDLKVWDLIGRSVVARRIHPDGSLGTRDEDFSMGVVARSAGVRENPKKICLCDAPSF